MSFNRYTIAEIAGIASSTFLALLVSVAVGAVLLRYIFGSPIIWAEEFEIFTFLWVIMLGAVYSKRNNTLLRVDILYNMFPPKIQRFVTVFQEFVHIAMFCAMIYYGYALAVQFGTKTMPILGWKFFYLYISLPIAAFGMLVVTIFQIIDLLRGVEE